VTPDEVFQWVALVGGLTGVGTFITAIYSRKKILAEAEKSDADSARILSSSSVAMLKPMQTQITRLSQQLERSQNRADALDHKLRATNDELDLTKQNIEDCIKIIDQLNSQLQRYRDNFGPLPEAHS
jgi:septal ring factor EnvC (AmiA/AmiB activator)